MQVEIVAIGDELTSGARLDTNSQWLSRQFTDLGLKVIAHTTIADNLEHMVAAIKIAYGRAEIVVCSGGLGPTADDLTREAIAKATGVELVRDPQQLEHIRGLFALRNREMPKRNDVQADFPAGSDVVHNPHGSAPGFCKPVARDGKPNSHIIALPGVPAELKEMFGDSVQPMILDWLGDQRRYIKHRCIRCFGIGESDLEQRLPDMIRRGRRPTVGITASKATITLRISAEGESENDCQSQIEQTESQVIDLLGDLVFGYDEDTLQSVLVQKMQANGKRMGVIEVGTKGLVAQWLRESESVLGSNCLQFAETFSSSFEAAENFRVANQQGSQSDLLKAITSSVRESESLDCVMMIGDFPTDEIPPEERLVWTTVSDHIGTKAKSFPFLAHPDILTERAAKQLLNLVRLRFLSL